MQEQINAKTISKLSIAQLRSCGLSRLKAKGIKSLAKQTLDKSFNPKLIPKMSDEEAIIYLSNLRQIGRWSAEMILLFTYNRSNIWPIQDIGLLRAISKNYKKKYFPPESYVRLLNKRGTILSQAIVKRPSFNSAPFTLTSSAIVNDLANCLCEIPL